jgi:DNA-binding MarR family transcriptional regulator
LPHGLTRAQFTVLNHCVRMGDNKTPAQLADILQVTRGTMTSTLARLEEKGFIRVEPDEVDGRSKRVLLTRKGRAAREESIRAALPLLSEARVAIPRDMVERMLPHIEVIRAWFDQNRPA